jgi:PAS domain S-box-containing protein
VLVTSGIDAPSAEFLAAVVESSNDAILTKSREGVITTWNGGAERLYGYSAQEAIGQLATFHIPRHRWDEENKILATACAGGTVEHYETERQRKDGVIVPVSLTMSPIRDGQGDVIGVSSIARDITDRRRSERLAMLGRMAAVVGHELRNPLASVVNALYLVRHSLEDNLSKEADEFLTLAERQADRAAQLATEITIYMREREPSLSLRAFGEVVRDVLESTPPPATIDVSVEGEGVKVNADAAQLVQMLTNLLSNAYQAVHGHGTVRIRAVDLPKETMVCVEDTGEGLADDTRRRVFEPFFTTRAEGTGLGLAIVQRLVEGHGGAAMLENVPGGGARASLRFPKRQGLT